VAYAEYVLKTFWPAHLAALYPHPAAGWAARKVVAGAALLVVATALAIRSRRPYLLVGWLWYLGTLLPVIGLVQVGQQAYADRYTYIPIIGLFIAFAWSLGQWATTPRPGSSLSLRAVARENPTLPRRLAAALVAAALLLALTVCTRLQTRYWKDSPTLFEHAIHVVDNNYLAEHELGMGLARNGRLSEALVHLRKAAAANPGWVQAHYNLACLLYFQDDYAQAADELAVALQRGFRPQNTGVLKLVHAIQQAAGR
jgi:tetratricopeptide (TPR) repeat protein